MSERRYLLDTNICIYLVESLNRNVIRRIGQTDPAEMAVSAISYAEIRRRAGHWDSDVKLGYQALFDEVTLLSFDSIAAETYALAPFKRHAFDRLIGAHAKSVGAVMVTANTADFSDIVGLEIEDWTL